MFYYHYINNGNGPKKLFISGVHGGEGESSFYFIKNLKKEDFYKGQIYIINFDKSKYISTLKKEFYETKIGKKIIYLIENIKPDFYTEFHCYDINNFENLTSKDRMGSEGVPPLIHIGNFILVSSVSPYIRMKYLKKETVCKTLEFPCFNKINDNFNLNDSIKTYKDFIKMIAISTSRKSFNDKMKNKYPTEYDLAIKYTKEIFGGNFLPF